MTNPSKMLTENQVSHSMDQSKADELITRYLTDTLSDDELLSLRSWLLDEETNRRYFLEMQEAWFSSVAADQSKRFDAERAYLRFISRAAALDENRKKESMIEPTIALSIKERWSQKVWLRYAAVACVLVLVFVGAFRIGHLSVENRFADIVVEAPLGSRTKVELPDGSSVWLNAGSKMIYSQGFGVGQRNLKLLGEGYFEVTKNAQLPFCIDAGEMKVKVLGTCFNFRNYPDDAEARVDLLEGKVRLFASRNERLTYDLKPHQKAVLNKRTGVITLTSTDVSKSVEWTKGYLYFDNTTLGDIVKELERSYSTQIAIEDSALTNIRFYAGFELTQDKIEDVLTKLTLTGDIVYARGQQGYIIRRK